MYVQIVCTCIYVNILCKTLNLLVSIINVTYEHQLFCCFFFRQTFRTCMTVCVVELKLVLSCTFVSFSLVLYSLTRQRNNYCLSFFPHRIALKLVGTFHSSKLILRIYIVYLNPPNWLSLTLTNCTASGYFIFCDSMYWIYLLFFVHDTYEEKDQFFLYVHILYLQR